LVLSSYLLLLIIIHYYLIQLLLIFIDVAILCGTFLLGIILFVIIYVYRLNKQYRRRVLEGFDEDDVYFTHRGNTVRYQDPLKNELEYTGYEKIDPEKANLIQNIPTARNNNYEKPPPTLSEVHRKASAPPLLAVTLRFELNLQSES